MNIDTILWAFIILIVFFAVSETLELDRSYKRLFAALDRNIKLIREINELERRRRGF